MPNCASGDNPTVKLCLWRQPICQTVPLATALALDCASDDKEQPKTAPGCRQVHSLARMLSPDAQFDPNVAVG